MALKDIGAGKIIARCHEYLVDLLFAPGTGRRGVYELVVRSSHIIAEDGMQSFAERSQIYMRRKLSQKKNPPKEPSGKELEDMRIQCASFEYRPKISIIVPVLNTREEWLRSSIESVLHQIYDNWELCIADDGSDQPHIRETLNCYQQKDARIKVKYLNENQGVSGASNEALAMASGEFIGFL
ncbi:MAG: hypothetical protein METHSR3v1_2430001, partial [Methanothrix sp.]